MKSLVAVVSFAALALLVAACGDGGQLADRSRDEVELSPERCEELSDIKPGNIVVFDESLTTEERLECAALLSATTTPTTAPSPAITDGLPANGSNPTPLAGGAPVAFETIDVGTASGIAGGQPQVFRIDTESEWEEFWSRHQAILTPQPALPAVDFTQEMVIAVLDQQKSSGGFLLEITAIEEAEGNLVIRVNRRVPEPDCAVAAVITQPFHIVRVPRSDLEPRLALSEETISCG